MPETHDHLTAKLIRHPESPGLGVMLLEAAVVRHPARHPTGELSLTYTLTGALHGLKIAPLRDGPSSREEGLWRHTCLELFAKVPGEIGYREYNFAPSGVWQAYAFRAYREGGGLQTETAPRITCTQTPTQLVMQVTLPAEVLPSGPLLLGLSAVIESRDGRLAYWALRHPKPKPDFHDAHAFILELP